MQQQPQYYVVGYTSDGQPVYGGSDGQPVYGGYGPPVYGGGSTKTNGLAIATLVLSLVLGFVAIPFGHVAKAQIRRTGEQGSGLATAGLVLGYLSLSVVIAVGSFFAYAAHQASAAASAASSAYNQAYAPSYTGGTGSSSDSTGTGTGSDGTSSGGTNSGSQLYLQPSPGDGSASGGSTYTAPTSDYPAPTGSGSSAGGWSAAYQQVTIPISGADWQGFTSDTGARCNARDPAMIIAASTDSEVVVCLTADHRYYYRGARTSDGASLEIEDPTPTSDGFLATNGGTTYAVSSSGLLITNSSGTVSNQTWDSYWTTTTQ